MSRNKLRSAPKAVQALPTQPRPVDAQGYVLDEWGLPLNGPARLRWLEKLRRPDPRDEPEAWSIADSAGTPPADDADVIPASDIPVTENDNG